MSQADSLPWGGQASARRTGHGTHRLVDLGRVLRALPWMGGSLAFAVAAMLLGLPAWGAGLFALVGLVVLRPTEQQRARLDRRATEGLPALVGRTSVATMVMVGLHAVALGRYDWWVGAPVDWALAGVVAAGLVVPVRAGLRLVVHALRRRGVGIEPALVVGAGPVGVAVAQVLRRRPEFGVRPVGFVDEFSDVQIDLPVVGAPRDLPELVTRAGVKRVIVAFGGRREHELVEMLRESVRVHADLQLNVLPRFYELGVSMGDETDDLWGYPLMAVRRPGPGPAARRLKRTLDVVGGAALLLLFSPVMAVLALLVRLSSPGPILFRQKRVGQDGRTFEFLKFRSMRLGDDDSEWETPESLVTRVGQFMRPTHLDELPQLMNVLRGDMSLVGPRPERPRYAAEFSEQLAGYAERHRVPVGLTGWAQVNGLWGETSMVDRARFDNRYIEDWSAWRDMEILLRTIPSMLGRRADEGAETTPEPGSATPAVTAPIAVAAHPRDPRRVVHVLQATDGATARHVVDLVQEQIEIGHHVHVVGNAGGHLERWLADHAVELTPWEVRDGAVDLPDVHDLGRVLADLDPGMVHLHGHRAGLAGRLVLQGSRPTVFQPHGWPFASMDDRADSAATRWEHLATSWAHAVVVTSEYERRGALQDGFAGPIHVHPLAVDVDHFTATGDDGRARARQELRVPDVPTVLCPGGIVPDKGVDLLLDVWPNVLAVVPRAHLLVAGDGPSEAAARARNSPRTTFTGWVDDLRPWYAAADLVVLPWRRAFLPLVALEAMASGRSLVATDVGALPEVVPAGAGQLVTPGRSDLLAPALADRLGDLTATHAEGRVGRRIVEASPSRAEAVETLAGTYRDAHRQWGGALQP